MLNDLDDNATLNSANSGALLSFSGGTTFDIKNHLLTVSGAGDVSIADSLTESIAGGQLTMSGTGTLTLHATSKGFIRAAPVRVRVTG